MSNNRRKYNKEFNPKVAIETHKNLKTLQVLIFFKLMEKQIGQNKYFWEIVKNIISLFSFSDPAGSSRKYGNSTVFTTIFL